MVKLKSKVGKSSAKKGDSAPVLSLKEQLQQKRKAVQARQELVQFLFLAILGSLVVTVLLAAVADPKVAVGGGVTLFCLSFSFKYPRKALWAFLIYMPFNGTVTYGLAGGNSLFQLAKDVFYLPALFGLIQECRQRRLPILIPKQFKPSLGFLLLICLVTLFVVNASQALDPQAVIGGVSRGSAERPFWLGVLGLKVLLGYVPLIFCAFYMLRTKKEFLFFARLTVVLVLVCCGLAFIQYLMLKTGRCEGTRYESGADLFKASLDARCFVGGALLYSPDHGVIRLPGTFVAPWQWGWFLIANAYFTFATAFSDPSFFWRNIGLSAMAVDFILAVLSGQRIALALVPISFVILLFLTGQVANLKRFIPAGVGLTFILGAAATRYPELVQERIDSFIGRWQASPADQFIIGQFQFVLRDLRGSLFGNGLGRATNSARILGETRLIETWFPKVMYEIGPIGLLAFFIMVTSLTYLTFKAYRSIKDKNLRSYGACCWVFILFISYNTYYYPLDVDPVAVYYWFTAGVIFRLPELDRQEQKLLKETMVQEKREKKKQRLNQEPSPAS